MQFDPNVMKKLLGENDATLWKTVRAYAAEKGIRLPEGQPTAKDMARLRAILAGCGAKDVESAMDVIRRARGEQ